ncbi:MAG: DUF4318 domain-containing protein [Lactobacillales bacterium]|jgi:hypothetical protein|nr:DUF4318 domain-containing protein [Lactobacillales bacterium]
MQKTNALKDLEEKFLKEAFYIEASDVLPDNASDETIVREITDFFRHRGESFEFISQTAPIEFRLNGKVYQAREVEGKSDLKHEKNGMPVPPIDPSILCIEV